MQKDGKLRDCVETCIQPDKLELQNKHVNAMDYFDKNKPAEWTKAASNISLPCKKNFLLSYLNSESFEVGNQGGKK